MKTLGGSIFIRNAISQDYHIVESINNLKQLCDKVVICDAGSDDGTQELIKPLLDEKTKAIFCNESMWHEQKTQSKLSVFTNIAINALDTDWQINLQGDEIIHEDSFNAIREAINSGRSEAFFCKRYNLWGDSQHYLNVSSERMPVGEDIIRIFKSGYQSVDDAQSIGAPADYSYLDKIRIYHTGFVRDKEKHMVKIENMMCNIFGWGLDDKLKGMGNQFNPWVHFSKEDVLPIKERLPKIIQEWAKERDVKNNF